MADLYVFDIQPAAINAIRVNREGKVNIVAACASVAASSDTLADAWTQACEQVGFSRAPSIVTISPEYMSFVNLVLPFQDRKKIEQVLPFELDDLIPGDIKSKSYDYLPAKVGDTRSDLAVAMMAKPFLAELLAMFQAAGVDPDRIGVSGQNLASWAAGPAGSKVVILDLLQTSITAFVYVDGNARMIRSYSTGDLDPKECLTTTPFLLWLQQTLLAGKIVDVRRPDYSIILSTGHFPAEQSGQLSERLYGVDVRQIPPQAMPLVKFSGAAGGEYVPEVMDRLVFSCTQLDRKLPEFNFRSRDFRRALSLPELKKYFLKVGIPALVLLAVLVVWAAQDYSGKVAERDDLQAQITAVFRETMPEVTRVVDPLQQLRVAVKEKKAVYRPSGGQNQFNVLKLLAELSARIPEQYKVRLTRLVADVDTIRLRGITRDFNTVDSIQRQLEKSPMFREVAISSANQSLQNNEVRFEMKLELFE